MNGPKLHGASRNGGGSPLPGRMRRIGKTLAATAAAMSLALMACSDGGKGKTPVKVTNPDDPKGEPGKVLSSLDSLVKANKGKGVVTGYLSGEGKTVAKGLLKQARNAAGEVRLLSRTEVPLSGATVLIFNAEKPTTVADTTLKTDSTGTYTAALAEGKYFGFAVYLDLETFQLVTTQIPNIAPRKDTVVKMDTAIAIEDVTAPTVVGVYDAASANDDGVFLVGAVPATDAKINIVFSEPMNRESAKGVVLGKVDTAASSTSLVLADTVKNVGMTWSGDSKELTLNVASLSEGVQYAIVIPVGLKDLAKNPLESKFLATFAPVKAEELKAVPFGVAATFPAKEGDKDGSLKPIQNPAVSFNRPVDVFSVVKGATIEPAHTGFWEVSGARAVFVHKTPFEVGRTYKVTLPAEIKDLAGNSLGAAQSFSFTVKDFEGAAASTNSADKAVALAVEAMFDAYLAGDIGRFAAAFHTNFRMFQGSTIQSKTQFIDKMKADLGERVNMKAGFLAPVFDNDSAACKDNVQRWKVAAQGDASAYLWVESFSNPGSVPRVWDKDRKEIDRSKLSWDKTGPRFTYEGKVYGFAPDFSRFAGGVNMDAARDNGRFMGELMARTSTIVLEPVKLDLKEEFRVDGGLVIKADTARLVVKLSGKETHSRTDFDPRRGCEGGAATQEHFEMLKFLLVNDGTRWMVLNIIAPEEQITNRQQFDEQVDVSKDFGGSSAAPIALTAPVNGRADALVDGKVAFKFNGVKHDSVGGYLVGLAEDPKFIGGRPPFGLLLFVKASKKDGSEETFSLDASAKVAAGNATSVLRRVHDLRLPGWERTLFEYTLTRLHNPDSGFAGVYHWKAIAVKDTSAAQFLQNGFKMERFLGESDFGPNRGHFAASRFPAATQFAQFENQQFVQPPVNGGAGGPMGFTDSDMDGVMDFMEQKYGSDPRDRNSYPDFRVDTDGDRMADFLEKKLDPEGKDSLVEKAADAAGLKAQIAALARLTPPIVVVDGDGDGFPDDVEQMLGFNPMDAFSNPGTRVRANVPVGVFAGKVQMGSSVHSVSFKLYQDSLKNLMVAFTAVMGRDTMIDTSRAGFNEMMGEVLMALRLPMNGPDAGRALLLRGNYQATQSLLMGPVDMISAPAKTSVSFGSGPYVGQFAASGRGEDVSRYLPGATTGPMPGPVTGPVVGPAPTIAYRPPPRGTSEGARIILGAQVIVIDDFDDTLAVFPQANWRSQPDGSFELFAEVREAIKDGLVRSEMGGRVMRSADGWVIDGHFRQSKDSAGIHRDIPGQLCARALAADLKPLEGMPGLSGTLKGWVALDMNGTGFTGPAPADSTACRPGMPCDPNVVVPPPTTTFSRPFMGGTARFTAALDIDGFKKGSTFPVSMNGQVFLGAYDSNGIEDAKSPWCGQVVLKLQPVPHGESATDEQKALYARNKEFLGGITGNNLVIAIEDQFRPGVPARIEKARDYLGNILVGVYVVEIRPAPMDYGRMACGTTGPVVGNPCPAGQTCPPPGGTTCPVGQVCPPPGTNNPPAHFTGQASMVLDLVDRAGNSVLLMKDATTPPQKVAVEMSSIKNDPNHRTVTATVLDQPTLVVVFLTQDAGATLMMKDGIPVVNLFGAAPQPTCPAGQTCPPPGGTPPGGTPPPAMLFLKAELSSVKANLAMQGGEVSTVRDSAGKLLPGPDAFLVESTLFFDSMRGQIVGKEQSGKAYAFLADGTETNPKMLNGRMVVLALPPPRDTTVAQPTCPAGQTCPPPGGTPPPEPAPYTGTLENLKAVLGTKDNRVMVMVKDAQALGATVNPNTIQKQGDTYVVQDATNPGKVYAFAGFKADPTKVFQLQDGSIAVMQLNLTAGP